MILCLLLAGPQRGSGDDWSVSKCLLDETADANLTEQQQ